MLLYVVKGAEARVAATLDAACICLALKPSSWRKVPGLEQRVSRTGFRGRDGAADDGADRGDEGGGGGDGAGGADRPTLAPHPLLAAAEGLQIEALCLLTGGAASRAQVEDKTT